MKKIDKKACRAYACKGIQISKNSGLLCTPQIEYVVDSQVLNIAHKRLLVLSFYPVKQVAEGDLLPRFVLFQGKDDFITLEHLPDHKTKWRKGKTRWVDREATTLTRRCAFHSRKDEAKVLRFCGAEGNCGFDALHAFQEVIRIKQSQQRRNATKRKIAETMKQVERRRLPKAFYSWAQQRVIPAHIFYDYRKGKTTHEGFCTRCKTDVMVTHPRHGKQGLCPNCKSMATFHATGRHSRVNERETTQVLQKMGDKLVIRIVKVYASFREYRNPDITYSETARYLCGVHNGKYTEKAFWKEYGSDPITVWRNGERPSVWNWWYNFRADNCGHVYPENLPKELMGTPWEYSQLREFYEHDGQAMYTPSYLSSFVQYPVLEYLMKLKLYRLVVNVVYGNRESGTYHKDPLNLKGTRLQEVLGVGKAYLPMLQAVDVNTHTLYLLQKLIEAGVQVEEGFLAWCQKNKIYDDRELLTCLRYGSQRKLMAYLNAQAAQSKDPRGMSHVFHLYKDYIRFCGDLQYNLRDAFILYPRNVQQAHDEASKMFNKKKVEIYNEAIGTQYPALLAQYQMADKGLMLLPPKTAEEIVAEGQALHHCVGGYVQRVVNKECVILFLRSEEAPDVPFYTIEVRNGKVAQIYGDRNCDPTEEVNAYMAKWKQEKLLPAIQAAA